MFFKADRERWRRIEDKLDLLIAAQKTPVEATETAPTEKEKPYKLNDKEMQEGIANLMSYDPFRKKRSDDE